MPKTPRQHLSLTIQTKPQPRRRMDLQVNMPRKNRREFALAGLALFQPESLSDIEQLALQRFHFTGKLLQSSNFVRMRGNGALLLLHLV